MKTVEEILEHFKLNASLFTQIERFSDKPGIYAVHFMGKAYPVYKMTPKINEIIYIGKTEKSQASRDAKTHFTSEKTGSSTLRRSFGALMREGAKLTPVPRSNNPEDEKRFMNYMFNSVSEERITAWMKNSLGLSFYEFEGSKEELDALETQLIRRLIPQLNIDHKNPSNPYLAIIKDKRADCVQLAKDNANYQPTVKTKNPVSANALLHIDGNGQGLYFEIWNTILPQLKVDLKKNENFYVQLSKDIFDSVGNRDSYSFSLVLNDRIVQNNIGGSAVARDLHKVISNDTEMKALLHNMQVKFKMDSKYYFSMEILLKQ